MRRPLLLLLAAAATALGAQPVAPALPADALAPDFGVATYRLWDGPAPGAIGQGAEDIPTVTVFRPQPHTGNGTAIVIAPGGAYLHLAENLEGRQVADWFTVRGVTAFVLTYRLGPRYLYPVPLEDAERAIRWVRAHAAEFHLRADRIGMMGFSAGGHLAAMTGVAGGPGGAAADAVDRENSRPDYLVLGYPWLGAMLADPPKPYIPSYATLMHVPEAERAELARRYTPALHVTRETPPTFIYSTTDDRTCPIAATIDFYRALIQAGVPVELHIYRHGRHGSGLGLGDPALDTWPSLLEGWLRGSGLLP